MEVLLDANLYTAIYLCYSSRKQFTMNVCYKSYLQYLHNHHISWFTASKGNLYGNKHFKSFKVCLDLKLYRFLPSRQVLRVFKVYHVYECDKILTICFMLVLINLVGFFKCCCLWYLYPSTGLNSIPGYLLCTFTLHVYETMHFIKFYVHIFQKSISLVFP